jgi:Holliday junction resolvasome RuvABC ATP-dependent DNA helicase subunit
MELYPAIIGQAKAKALLSESIAFVKKRNARFPHTIFESATGGTGKTSMVRLTAQYLDADVVTINAIDAKPLDIAKAIAKHNPFRKLVVFIEEWNSPNKALDYFLRPLIEEDRVLVEGEEYECDYLNQVSIIISSNDKTALPQPLLSRLERVKMVDYSQEELYKIACLYRDSQPDLKISDDALHEIASRSRGVPRTIVKIIGACYRHFVVTEKALSKLDVIDVMVNFDIYKHGLNAIDLKILKMLNDQDSLSLTALCGMTNETPESIRYQEALLMQLGLMEITNKRRITMKGRSFLRDL